MGCCCLLLCPTLTPSGLCCAQKCGKAGDLLCCDGCPDAYHLTCVGFQVGFRIYCQLLLLLCLPTLLLSFDCMLSPIPQSVPDDDWFCDKCKKDKCGACGKGHIELKSHIICGDDKGRGCDRTFHLV